MKTCRNFEGHVSEYIEDELAKNSKSLLEAHLQSCQHCAQIINSVNALRRSLRNIAKVKTSDDFDNMLRARIRLENRKSRFRRESIFSSWKVRIPAYGMAVVFVIFAVLLISQKVQQQKNSFPQAAAQLDWMNGRQAVQQQNNPDGVKIYFVDREPAIKVLSPTNFVKRWERTRESNSNLDTNSITFPKQKLVNMTESYNYTKSY